MPTWCLLGSSGSEGQGYVALKSKFPNKFWVPKPIQRVVFDLDLKPCCLGNGTVRATAPRLLARRDDVVRVADARDAAPFPRHGLGFRT